MLPHAYIQHLPRGQDDLIAQDVIHQLMSSIDMDCVPRLNIRPIDLSKRDFHILSLHFVHGSCSSIDTMDTLITDREAVILGVLSLGLVLDRRIPT